MQGGEITGRRFISDGTISGRGVIDTTVHNDGLVEAIGGTLQFLDLDLDGTWITLETVSLGPSRATSLSPGTTWGGSSPPPDRSSSATATGRARSSR
jgi:hypothetical protein